MQPLGRGHVWSHPHLPSGCTPMPPTAALRSGPTTPHQANQLMGLGPGEVFVQRNVGNLVTHKDMNAMSCLEYAVTALKVKHIIVCGHHNCGAVKGALTMPNRQQGTGSGTVCLGPRGTDQITPGIVGAPTRGDESQFIAAMGCPGLIHATRQLCFSTTTMGVAPSTLTDVLLRLTCPGLVNLWIQDIRDTRDRHALILKQFKGDEQVPGGAGGHKGVGSWNCL